MRLFQTESRTARKRFMPRSAHGGPTDHRRLRRHHHPWQPCVLVAGMSPFERINHAMSRFPRRFFRLPTILGQVDQPAVHGWPVVIIILGSLPFTLYVETLRGNRRAVDQGSAGSRLARDATRDLLVLGTCTGGLPLHWLDALRHVALNVTSVVTTTGFCPGRLQPVGQLLTDAVFLSGFVGGCSGSTAGRDQDLSFSGRLHPAQGQLNQLIHRGSDQTEVQRHRLDEEIVRSISDVLVLFRHHHLRDRPGRCRLAGLDG